VYPVFYMPIDHRPGDSGTGMIYQIVGTLRDELHYLLLIILIAVFADNRFMAAVYGAQFLIEQHGKALEVFVSIVIRTHERNYTMSNTNPLTEIGAIVLAALLAIGGVLLLYAGKIDTAFATSMFILAAGLLGINQALKAPSSAQQQQLGALAQQGQALTSQVLSVLPTVVAATQQPTPAAQPVPTPMNATPNPTVLDLASTTTVQPQFVQFAQSPLAAIAPTGQMPAVVLPPETK